ncbi:hypothetical protein JCM8547_004398 [Rhodosporidiobolus lusitaniae]
MARTGADQLSFAPVHSLLNSKFESYKLSPPSLGEAAMSTFALSKPFSFPKLPDHARLSYAETAARARHNHLAAGEGGELVWVDGEGEVTALEVDQKTGAPTFHSLARLPLHVSSDSVTPEYPTAISLSSFLWVISSGRGTLHVLRINRTSSPWIGTFESFFELRDGEDEELTPFRLHAAKAISETEAVVLLSKVVKGAPAPATDPADSSATPSSAAAKTRLKLASSTAFEYLSVRISLTPAAGQIALTVDWRLRGNDLPAFVEFEAVAGRYCIGASAPLCAPGAPVPFPSAMDVDTRLEAAEAEANAALLDPSSSSSSTSAPIPRPPPFSWLQDKECLTVAFPLPSDLPTSSIRITFSRQYLTLHIASPASLASSSLPGGASTLPRISHKKLWAEIDPHTSVWTFDREAEGRDSTFGILTLHLEKQYAGTRWTDVFAPTSFPGEGGSGGSGAKIEELDPEQDYEDVPETMDPSELAAISEKMEQWAQGIAAGSSGGGRVAGGAADGIGHGVPTSLLGDEMDVEVDAESGRQIVVSWVEGATKEGGKKQPEVVVPHRTIPYALLSTALPLAGTSSSSGTFDPTISIKHDVDGLLFSPPSSSSTYTWTHRSTLPALAFVLATKRDTRFVYHVRSPSPSSPLQDAVLAFDAPALLPGPTPSSSALARGGGNLFVYIAPKTGWKEKTGKQMVVRVGGQHAGALVGAAGVRLEGGEVAILVLCEREVGVLRIFA